MKAGYDIERAKLDVSKGDTVSRLDNEQAKLARRRRAAEAARAPGEGQVRSDVRGSRRFGEAAQAREGAVRSAAAPSRGCRTSQLRAPAAGMVNVLPNFRSGGMFGGQQDFQQGDRAWPGAAILELPDLSSVHLEARLDESDRGRLQPQQEATVRIEALPGKDFKARLDSISVLARVDFSSGWPPAKNFDLNLVFLDVDSRMRPGMTAVARIATERVPDVVLVPVRVDLSARRRAVVYKLERLDVRRDAGHDPKARQGAGDRRRGRRARRSHCDPPSAARADQEERNEAPHRCCPRSRLASLPRPERPPSPCPSLPARREPGADQPA